MKKLTTKNKTIRGYYRDNPSNDLFKRISKDVVKYTKVITPISYKEEYVHKLPDSFKFIENLLSKNGSKRRLRNIRIFFRIILKIDNRKIINLSEEDKIIIRSSLYKLRYIKNIK